MDHVELQLAALSAKVEAGFSSVEQRLDDQQEVSRDRHVDNVARLVRIEKEARETNGRVTRHDEQIRTLFRRPKANGEKPVEGQERRITQRDVWLVALGGGTVWAVLKGFGLIASVAREIVR